MIKINDPEHFAQVCEFALNHGCTRALVERLDWLAQYGGALDFATCTLYPDHAPHSFAFVIEKDGARWFNGGLIYSGPGQPLDGSAPALTVGIGIDDSTHGWSVHT
jgi:hypothetical protein